MRYKCIFFLGLVTMSSPASAQDAIVEDAAQEDLDGVWFLPPTRETTITVLADGTEVATSPLATEV